MPHTILLADDSVTIRRVVELAFQDTDIHVDAVGSGSEAMDRLAASHPDLVLVDVVLPTPSGYDLCRAVKNSDRPVPVLLLRGAFEPFDERRASGCGADGSIIKPFDAERLVERVRALLERAPATADRPEEAGDGEQLQEALEPIVNASVPVPDPPPSVAETGATEPTEESVDDDAPESVPVEVVHAPAATVDDARASDTLDEAPVRADGPTRVATEASIEDPTAVPVRIVDVERSAVDAPGAEIDPDPALVAAVADAVVRRLSDRVIRELAWEVVPDLAAALIRQRLREIEREDPEDR